MTHLTIQALRDRIDALESRIAGDPDGDHAVVLVLVDDGEGEIVTILNHAPSEMLFELSGRLTAAAQRVAAQAWAQDEKKPLATK